MVRNYKSKTERSSISEETMAAAVNSIINNKVPVRAAAAHYNINQSTLFNHIKKYRQSHEAQHDSGNSNEDDRSKASTSKYGSTQIFTVNKENSLKII